MRRWIAVLAVLGLAQPGCGQSTQPRMVQISGFVTTTSGRPAQGARVIASTLDTEERKQRRQGVVLDAASADGSGRYSLSVPASPDSISLTAEDAFAPGDVRNGILGHVTHVLATHTQTVDMVLDRWIPS